MSKLEKSIFDILKMTINFLINGENFRLSQINFMEVFIMFSKTQISLFHNVRRKFVKKLLSEIDCNNSIEHYCSRVKDNDSIASKLWSKQKNATVDNALFCLTDIIGVRIVVHYIGDIYKIAFKIRQCFDVEEEIDYITNPKENGYRSLHLIVMVPVPEENDMGISQIPIEVQIRTEAMDYWASLEHEMLYKKDHSNDIGQMNLAKKELYSCAETLFSLDMKMESVQSIIQKTERRTYCD